MEEMTEPKRPQRTTEKPTLLCVEDDCDWQELLKEFFRKSFPHVEIIYVADLHTAQETLKARQVDIVTTDISYPYSPGDLQKATAGIELMADVIKDHSRSIPCIAMTSVIDAEPLLRFCKYYKGRKGVDLPLLDKGSDEFFPDLARRIKEALVAALEPAPKSAKEARL